MDRISLKKKSLTRTNYLCSCSHIISGLCEPWQQFCHGRSTTGDGDWKRARACVLTRAKKLNQWGHLGCKKDKVKRNPFQTSLVFILTLTTDFCTFFTLKTESTHPYVHQHYYWSLQLFLFFVPAVESSLPNVIPHSTFCAIMHSKVQPNQLWGFNMLN